MTDYLQTILAGQYLAALSMLYRSIERCPETHWESKIANGTVRWAAYHTLFFAEYYVSSEAGFVPRAVHAQGGDERSDEPAVGLDRHATLAYCAECRSILTDALARETDATLQGHCGFSWMDLSRGELHLYNIRHIQHHAAQIGAHLRRLGIAGPTEPSLRWARSGWHTA